MSRQERQFQFARLELSAIERIFENWSESRSNRALKAEELTAAKDCVELCGRILNHVFSCSSAPESLLEQFVLKRDLSIGAQMVGYLHDLVIEAEGNT